MVHCIRLGCSCVPSVAISLWSLPMLSTLWRAPRLLRQPACFPSPLLCRPSSRPTRPAPLVRTLPSLPAPALAPQVTRGVMYTREEAEGKRLRHPFDTITGPAGLVLLRTGRRSQRQRVGDGRGGAVGSAGGASSAWPASQLMGCNAFTHAGRLRPDAPRARSAGVQCLSPRRPPSPPPPPRHLQRALASTD